MRGRLFLINFILGVLLLSLLLPGQACFASAKVVALLSDEEFAYRQPLSHLEAALGLDLPVYNLQGDIENAPQVMAEVLAAKPELVVALGAKAAFVAKTWSKEQQTRFPILFAMVLNWQRYNLLETPNIAGIAVEASAGTQLANLAMFSPHLKKLGVVYSEEFTADYIKEIKDAASILGIEIVEERIDQTKEFRLTYKKLAGKVDGFWLLADPLLYSMENVAWLKKQCIKDRLICIGQSSNIAKAGILLAVDSDPAGIGEQAASLVRAILNGSRKIEQIGVMQPLGTKVILNMRTAREIGLDINKQRRDLADTVIDY